MRKKIVILSILFIVFVGLGCGFLFSPKLRSSAAVLAQSAARNIGNTASRLSPAPPASGRFSIGPNRNRVQSTPLPRASRPSTASPEDKAKTTPPPEFQSKAGPLTDADFTEFSDVSNDTWYYWYAHAAVQNDITSAIGNNFNGSDLIWADSALGEIFNATGQPLCCVGWNRLGQSCHQGCYEMNIPYQSPSTYMSSDFWFYPPAVTSIIDNWSDTILHTFKPEGYNGTVFNYSCKFGEAVFNDTVARALRIPWPNGPDVPTGYPNGRFSDYDPDEWHDGCLGEQPSLNRAQAAAILTWNFNDKPIYLGLGGAVMPQADDDVTREHLSEVDGSSVELLDEDGQTVPGATATLIYDGNNMLGFNFEDSVHLPIQDWMNTYKNQRFYLRFNLPEGFELISSSGNPYLGDFDVYFDRINKDVSPLIRYSGNRGKIEGQIFLPEGCSEDLAACSELFYLYYGTPYDENLEWAIHNDLWDKNIYAWCPGGNTTYYNVGEGKISSGSGGMGLPLSYLVYYLLPEGVTGDDCYITTDPLSDELPYWARENNVILEEGQDIEQNLVINSEVNTVFIRAVDADSGENIAGATITYQQDNPNVTLDGGEAEVTDQNGIAGFRLGTSYNGDFPQNVTLEVTPPEDSDYVGKTIQESLSGCVVDFIAVELEHDNGCQTVDGVEICWQGEEANQMKTDYPDLADQIAAAVTNFGSQSHRPDLPKRVNVVSGQGNGWTMTAPQNGLWGEIQIGTDAISEVLSTSPDCIEAMIANEFGNLFLSILELNGDSSFEQHDFWYNAFTSGANYFNDAYCGKYTGCETGTNPPADYYGLFGTTFCTMTDDSARTQFGSFIPATAEPEKTWLKDLYNNQGNLLGLPNIAQLKNYFSLR